MEMREKNISNRSQILKIIKLNKIVCESIIYFFKYIKNRISSFSPFAFSKQALQITYLSFLNYFRLIVEEIFLLVG